MAVDQLGRKPVENIVNGKRGLFFRHLGIEEHLQQQIAEFPGEFGPVAIIDGFQNFVGFFQGVGLDGIEGLFAIPGAAARGAQTLHDGDRAFETFSCGGHSATNVNDSEGGRQCRAHTANPTRDARSQPAR